MKKSVEFVGDMNDMICNVSEVLDKLNHIERLRSKTVTKVLPQAVQEKNRHFTEYRTSIIKRDLLKMQGAVAKAKRHAQRVNKLRTNVSLLLYEIEYHQNGGK